MSVSDIEEKIIKLSQEELAFETSGNTAEARRVKIEWCMIRDSLSGHERERCIDLSVAVHVPMSSEALDLLKEQSPSIYSAYKDVAEFVS